MRALKYIVVISVAVSAVLSAAAVWEEKPFTEWSEKDVEKILTESPWAGKASITHEKAGADLGPVPDWKLIVSVRSATPIRQALARQQLLAGATASPDLESNLAAPHPRYAFAIARIPQFYRPQLTKSAQVAVMKRKGKSVNATEASVTLLDKDGNVVQPPAPRGRRRAAGQQRLAERRSPQGSGTCLTDSRPGEPRSQSDVLTGYLYRHEPRSLSTGLPGVGPLWRGGTRGGCRRRHPTTGSW